MDSSLYDRQGFTLLELIAVMLLLSILGALVVPRFVALDANANSSAVDYALSELNGREGMIWADIKSSKTGYDNGTGDNDIWALMKDDPTSSHPYLGDDYKWNPAPTQAGGKLSFQNKPGVTLNRTASTRSAPARWSR
jgi:prepilin-type N-terminal cleavage/methylation domain-containing protein